MTQHDDINIQFPYEYSGELIWRSVNLGGSYLTRCTQTPEMMIQMDGFLDSSLKGYEDHSPLYYKEYGIGLEKHPDTSVSFQGSGSVKLEDLVIVLPHHTSLPPLVKNLRTGTAIEKISIKEISWAGGDKPIVRNEHVFGGCYLVYWRPMTFCHLMVIRPEEWLYKAASFDQSNAQKRGNTEDKFSTVSGSDNVKITATAG
ncbi:MAG: hypothetical protein KBB83_01890 [Alphaproteobacteria bacterium]|nr:hypothetical protein [Alphaproteobacteria bacterium]